MRTKYVIKATLTAAMAALALGLTACTKPAATEAAPAAAAAAPAAEPVSYVKWTDDGKLTLPTGYRDWVFIGSPLTPNGLNGGKAGFPEFHNVYVPKEQLRHYEQTGVWEEGSIWVKELQLTGGKAENADGSHSEPSGRGYFPGEPNGMDVMVKDSQHCKLADQQGWCFFNFGHHAAPYEPTSQEASADHCGACHIANAGGDDGLHFYKFYSLINRPANAKQ